MPRRFLTGCLMLCGLNLAVAAGPDLGPLTAALGGNEPDAVSATKVPGLYEVTFGSQIVYLSEDGRYAVRGDLIDLASLENLTDARREGLRLAAVDAVGEDNMVIFEPEGEVRHTVTVFTDIDCGYCRKLHREMASYLDEGIRVRYLAFPRAGIGSESYQKAVSVWCSEDTRDAMTRAKRGEDVGSLSCPNPVAQHYQLGRELGVTGTPSLVLESGRLMPGYLPATRLAQILDQGVGR